MAFKWNSDRDSWLSLLSDFLMHTYVTSVNMQNLEVIELVSNTEDKNITSFNLIGQNCEAVMLLVYPCEIFGLWNFRLVWKFHMTLFSIHTSGVHVKIRIFHLYIFIFFTFFVFFFVIMIFLSNYWTIIPTDSIMSTSCNMFSLCICSGWTPIFIWIFRIRRTSFIFYTLINKRKLAYFTILCCAGCGSKSWINGNGSRCGSRRGSIGASTKSFTSFFAIYARIWSIKTYFIFETQTLLISTNVSCLVTFFKLNPAKSCIIWYTIVKTFASIFRFSWSKNFTTSPLL